MNISVHQVNLNYSAEVCGNLTLDMYNETQVRRVQMLMILTIMILNMMILRMILIAECDHDSDDIHK